MSKKRTNFNAMLRCWLLRMFKHPKFDELMHWPCRTFNLGKCTYITKWIIIFLNFKNDEL